MHSSKFIYSSTIPGSYVALATRSFSLLAYKYHCRIYCGTYAVWNALSSPYVCTSYVRRTHINVFLTTVFIAAYEFGQRNPSPISWYSWSPLSFLPASFLPAFPCPPCVNTRPTVPIPIANHPTSSRRLAPPPQTPLPPQATITAARLQHLYVILNLNLKLFPDGDHNVLTIGITAIGSVDSTQPFPMSGRPACPFAAVSTNAVPWHHLPACPRRQYTPARHVFRLHGRA